MSEAPAIAVKDDDDSILPGAATADLDWDDQEESTHVFAEQSADLFQGIEASKAARAVRVDADDTAKRNVGMAAALLKGSGRTAAAVPMVVPTPAPPPVMAQIPAPAPVPREIPAPAPSPPSMPRPKEPSWQAPPAAGEARRGPVPYLIALVALVAIIAVVFVVLRSDKGGGGALRIDVVYQGAPVDVAEVYIEGQRRCDNTPCTVKDLKAGKYNVKVVAKDKGSRVLDVQIDSGAETPVTVDIGVAAPVGPEKSAPPVASQPPPATGPATIKLASKQGGVKVIVDGVEKTTLDKGKPYELKDLKPGTVKIKLVGPKEFAAKEMEVDIAAGATKDLGEIALTLLKVKVTFVLVTPAAGVKLTNEDDKKSEILDFRLTRDNKIERTLDTSKRWTLEAAKKGFADLKDTLTFDDDKPEKTVNIELQQAPEVQPPLVGSAATVTPPASSSAKTPPPAGGGKATISMNSIPPSNVLLDGQPLGLVPQTKQVEPGTHNVTFIHKTRGRKQRTVTVAAGENKAVAVTFKESEGG